MIPSLGCHVIELGKGGPVALTDYCNGDQTHKYTHGARKLVGKHHDRHHRHREGCQERVSEEATKQIGEIG